MPSRSASWSSTPSARRRATGAYGGQPLSSAYATAGKGYAARLMSK